MNFLMLDSSLCKEGETKAERDARIAKIEWAPRNGSHVCDHCHLPPGRHKECTVVRIRERDGTVVFRKFCASCLKEIRNRRNEALQGKFDLSEAEIYALQGVLRRTMIGAKQRKINWHLSLEDIAKLWHGQRGLCALTGMPMRLVDRESNANDNASLDRIDSLGSYRPHNVQFVWSAANIAKGTLTNDEFVDLCARVVARAVQSA